MFTMEMGQLEIIELVYRIVRRGGYWEESFDYRELEKMTPILLWQIASQTGIEVHERRPEGNWGENDVMWKNREIYELPPRFSSIGQSKRLKNMMSTEFVSSSLAEPRTQNQT